MREFSVLDIREVGEIASCVHAAPAGFHIRRQLSFLQLRERVVFLPARLGARKERSW